MTEGQKPGLRLSTGRAISFGASPVPSRQPSAALWASSAASPAFLSSFASAAPSAPGGRPKLRSIRADRVVSPGRSGMVSQAVMSPDSRACRLSCKERCCWTSQSPGHGQRRRYVMDNIPNWLRQGLRADARSLALAPAIPISPPSKESRHVRAGLRGRSGVGTPSPGRKGIGAPVAERKGGRGPRRRTERGLEPRRRTERRWRPIPQPSPATPPTRPATPNQSGDAQPVRRRPNQSGDAQPVRRCPISPGERRARSLPPPAQFVWRWWALVSNARTEAQPQERREVARSDYRKAPRARSVLKLPARLAVPFCRSAAREHHSPGRPRPHVGLPSGAATEPLPPFLPIAAREHHSPARPPHVRDPVRRGDGFPP
jgi:hypothetical protein